MKQITTLLGAMLAAVAASACCVLPALLGVAGAGALGFGAALEPYRPYFIGLTVLLLGAAFYFAYRPATSVCDGEGRCASSATTGIQRFNRVMLWGVALLAVAAMAYPQVASYRAQAAAPATAGEVLASVEKQATTAMFAVGNLTCPKCTTGITEALKKTPGVRDVRVDFDTTRGTVRYDASRVRVPQLRAVIERSGFSAKETS